MRSVISSFVGVLVALGFSTAALAQDYPNKPIRLLVPWPTSSPPDVVSRLVTARMSQSLGQPILVENRPGAGGTIGLMEFMKAPADGYTLFLLGSGQAVMPVLYPNVKVDLTKDLAPIILLEAFANVLVVSPESPIKSAKELVEMMRKKPGHLSFGSGGNGTPAHMSGELFKQTTKTFALHLPYNNFAQAIGDTMTGRLDFMFLAAAAAVPQIRGGKLRPFAVTGAERIPSIKDVPTMREAGFPDFVIQSWGSVAGHANLPKPIIDRLNTEFQKSLDSPEVKEGLARIASEPIGGSPAKLAEWVKRDIEAFGKIAQQAGMKAD
jgi:tripartite-type tricarboxylate transporter receptor subunit TctC